MTGVHAQLLGWLRKTVTRKLLSAILALSLLFVAAGLRAEERFNTLTVGANTYSNVTVISKNSRNVTITHSKGLASFRVNDLTPKLQTQLGYIVEEPRKMEIKNPLAEITKDPQVAKLQEQWIPEVNRVVAEMDDRTMQAVTAVLVLAYLFYCYCCRLICRKAGSNPGVWVWIPVLQLISMFRAARMSGWNFLLIWLPVVGTIVSIVWCFKICIARQKSGWLGLLLLLPITNLLVFFYLAFADRLESRETGVVKLQFT